MLRIIVLSISLLPILLVSIPTEARSDEDVFLEALRRLTEGTAPRQKREQPTPLVQQLTPSELEDEAAEAAAKAEQKFGGRALAVTPYREGFRVRLLLDGGRVTTVTIDN